MSNPLRSSEDGVVRLVDDLLDKAIARRASDVHFEPIDDGLRVRYRLDGILHDVDILPRNLTESIVARLKVLAGLLTYRIDIPQEGSFSRPPASGPVSGGRASRPPSDPSCGQAFQPPSESKQKPATQAPSLDIRVATFPTIRGERAIVRLLSQSGSVGTLDRLGLSPGVLADLRQAAAQPHGLILVTGPAGSGKSTTLYALARHILVTTPGRSVVTLEDPVEQRIDGLAQIQVAPHGELDYVRAMRSLLRQDVEVLLVGEIRDAQTAGVVVEAALTGHLIMSTMHSGDPAEAIVRLLEMGIASYQLVGALTLVCSQRLLRSVCTACTGRGCDACGRTGYCGRTACGQSAVMDEPLRKAVLAHAPAGELRRLIGAERTPLAADAQRLVDSGKTTQEEVLRVFGEAQAAPTTR
jgi:general secretion pathway protein E